MDHVITVAANTRRSESQRREMFILSRRSSHISCDLLKSANNKHRPFTLQLLEPQQPKKRCVNGPRRANISSTVVVLSLQCCLMRVKAIKVHLRVNISRPRCNPPFFSLVNFPDKDLNLPLKDFAAWPV
ncbi:hypothetical protein JOB18_010168 [Solea senegalensis]|uniref:Uncharacterized protein n=1 Tax=Solea senegalensis TaxID=28829 RepID=A0AAV6R9B7_SOLSE|nr:hypothetical protein JOB18_010168 [Solea senegalensis]